MMRRQVLLSWSGGKDSALSLQEQRFQRSDDLQHTAHDLALLGGPGPFVIGAGLYTAGRLTRMPSLARGALHMTAAFLLAASVTGLGKGISGRALPSVNDSNPENFQFGRGFHDRNGPFVSFPSGHATASFAMAAALTSEVDLRRPGMGRIVRVGSRLRKRQYDLLDDAQAALDARLRH